MNGPLAKTLNEPAAAMKPQFADRCLAFQFDILIPTLVAQSQPERGNTMMVWLPRESEPRALSSNAGEGTVGLTAFDASA